MGLFLTALEFGVFLTPSAQAMPMFARKYKFNCAMCHASVPRLNALGFKFKAAGYRMPYEIGKEQDENLLKFENYTAFVAILSAPFQVQTDQSQLGSTITESVQANEIDVHPITGSYGKYWGSAFELDGYTDGTVALNQAFLTFTNGEENSFYTVQVGVFPNFLGYGPLDRPQGVSAPLFLTQSANNTGLDTLFNWSGPRAAGLTGSYWIGETLLSASVRNRLTDLNGGGLDAAANGGHMGDIEAQLTSFYDHVGSGSAVSAFYYKGHSQIPVQTGNTALYGNSYNHLGVAINKYFNDNLNVFVGGGWNMDQRYEPLTGYVDSAKLHSYGSMLGVEYFWNADMMAGLRLDQFRTDTSLPDTGVMGGALYTVYHPINWIIFAAEYQYLYNGMNTANAGNINGGTNIVTDHIFTLQATLVF